MRSRKIINPNINIIKPGLMQSTQNQKKSEYAKKKSPSIING